MTSLSGIHRVAPAPSLIGAGFSDTNDQRSRARRDATPQAAEPSATTTIRTVGFFVDAFA